MKLTQKLLGYLHRVFDKDPRSFLAFRLRYAGTSMTWEVSDNVLTTTVAGGFGVGLSIDLTRYTVSSLVNFLAASPGYSIEYADGSELSGLSAKVLIDGSGDQDASNGDHITGYTSLLWVYLEPFAVELKETDHQVDEALRQMNMRIAEAEWLDEWGGYYGISRKPDTVLITPARTNILVYSQQFDQWAATGATVSPDQIIAPDGTKTADKLEESAVTNYHQNARNFSLEESLDYTLSCYLKKGTRNYAWLETRLRDGTYCVGVFDLDLGVTATALLCTSAITADKNGWFRCSITFNSLTGATTTSPVYVGISNTSSTAASYLGAVGQYIYEWGVQLEAAPAPGDYIPTTATPVTVPAVYGPELDTTYSGRIIIEVMRPRGNNIAIEEIARGLLGQPVTVYDVRLWGAAAPVYNGTNTHNSLIQHNASAVPVYGLFDVDYVYNLESGLDVSEYALQLAAIVETMRDAGTHLRAMNLASSNLSDTAGLSPFDSADILITTGVTYNSVVNFDGIAKYSGVSSAGESLS